MSIAVVQSVLAAGSAVTSVTTAAISTTTGNLVVIDNVNYNVGQAYLSQSDSQSLTWSNSVAQITNTSNSGRQNYNANITGSASHTFTLTLNAPGGYPTLCVTEVSGQAASPLDQTASGTAGTGSSHTTPSTSTTAQANELLLGCGWNLGTLFESFSVSSPWTQTQEQDESATLTGLVSAYQIVSSTGTYAFTFGSGATGSCSGWISTWLASATAVADVVPLYGRIEGLHQQSYGLRI